jgi:hypothetical protein
MNRKVRIKFQGGPEAHCFFLSLGPICELDITGTPVERERQFRGGTEIQVLLRDLPDDPDSVDLVFEDGEFALGVPRDYFVVLGE